LQNPVRQGPFISVQRSIGNFNRLFGSSFPLRGTVVQPQRHEGFTVFNESATPKETMLST
jgi:hypothetical protein